MKIGYRKADIVDAELLIDIYDSSFYSDYVKYGECPAYGKTKEMMEKLAERLFGVLQNLSIQHIRLVFIQREGLTHWYF